MDLDKITAELKDKYKDLGIERIELSNDGKASFYVRPTEKILAFSETASVVYRDKLSRELLDLVSGSPRPSRDKPQNLFKKSYELYWDADVYGSVIDVLVNLSIKGFENDIGDKEIKYFYDSWCIYTDFTQVLEWIFLDFFRVGMVRTYKILGKFELPVTYLQPPEKLENGRAFAAKKKRWSKSHIPISYTVLNPLLIEVTGSLLFDKTKVVLKPNKELLEMVKKSPSKLTSEEKEIIRRLPSKFKKDLKSGKGIELDPELVGEIDYRKMPYERYPRPRGTRAFESIAYKNALREADLSTLDGISNYILKITVGNDQYPVTSQEELDKIAQLFNTPAKAFNVVWNHTLQIERIISPEIESILGKDKYEQVNEDISGALGFPRAFLDGTQSVNSSTAAILAQVLVEEINYARMKVTRWIYNEYQQIAEAMGFKQYPRIRWDSTILKDIILYMSIVSQLVDRRMLSYRTALERLGFDFDNELNNVMEEFPYVMDGYFGIIGSPWQQAKQGMPIDVPLDQKTQKAPKGTPSYGRPKGKAPTKKKSPKGMSSSVKLKLLEMAEDDSVSMEEFIEELQKYRLMEVRSGE